MGAVVSEREEHWRRHVAAWRRSGLNQAEYCRQQGQPTASFSWWKHELARRDAQRGSAQPVGRAAKPEQPSLFVPVQIAARSDGVACEIVLRSGQRLRVNAGAETKWIAELARCLEAVSC